MKPQLAEAIELLEDAMHQGCNPIDEQELDPMPGQPARGTDWLDTGALSTWRDIGDWLVTHAGWERHPNGAGRRWFYRPPAEEEA